jgi:uncharacterized membrane protein YbhN (UPF0104 family)
MASASWIGLAAALALVSLEVALRARRWQVLLQAFRPVAYSRSVAYLCVGYFANSLLPARLGDLARAHLAGRDFEIPRLATLGTIVVERVADGGLILATVVLLGLMTPAAHQLLEPAVAVLLIGGAAGMAILLILVAIDRWTRATGGIVAGSLAIGRRISFGAAALHTRDGIIGVSILTIVAFLVAIVGFWVVAEAVGLRLTVTEAAIVMGALALSTSIPAAPGSLGTYELVGVAVLTQLGAPAAPALAAVVLTHVIATLPPALVGLAVFVRLNLRVIDLRTMPATDRVPTA